MGVIGSDRHILVECKEQNQTEFILEVIMKRLYKGVGIPVILACLLIMTGCNFEMLNENNDKDDEADRQKVSGEVGKQKLDKKQAAENEKREHGDAEFRDIFFSVLENGEEVGTFVIDLTKLKEVYHLDDDYEVAILGYYPDYELVDGEPISNSDYPFNPAFIFEIKHEGEEEKLFFNLGSTVSAKDDPKFDIELIDFTLKD